MASSDWTTDIKGYLFSMCINLPLPNLSGYDEQYNAMQQIWIYLSYLFSIKTYYVYNDWMTDNILVLKAIRRKYESL